MRNLPNIFSKLAKCAVFRVRSFCPLFGKCCQCFLAKMTSFGNLVEKTQGKWSACVPGTITHNKTGQAIKTEEIQQRKWNKNRKQIKTNDRCSEECDTRSERKGKERKGKERKGREGKGKERKGKAARGTPHIHAEEEHTIPIAREEQYEQDC